MKKFSVNGAMGLWAATKLIMVLILLSACSESGPSSTQTRSDAFNTLEEKISFLEQYVVFKRNYQALDFSVSYADNSGGWVPGPSDWDIRIIAVVPPEELAQWTSGLSQIDKPESQWLDGIPTTIDYAGIEQWYRGEGNKLVGVDDQKSTVVYRIHTN